MMGIVSRSARIVALIWCYFELGMAAVDVHSGTFTLEKPTSETPMHTNSSSNNNNNNEIVVTGFSIWNPDNNTMVQPIANDGISFCLNLRRFNIKAYTIGGPIGSVYMNLDGPIAVTGIENVPPYFLGKNHGDNVFPIRDQLVPGKYTMTAIPYSRRDQGGVPLGQSLSMDFIIDCGEETILTTSYLKGFDVETPQASKKGSSAWKRFKVVIFLSAVGAYIYYFTRAA